MIDSTCRIEGLTGVIGFYTRCWFRRHIGITNGGWTDRCAASRPDLCQPLVLIRRHADRPWVLAFLSLEKRAYNRLCWPHQMFRKVKAM
jgi:hypothetical protein